jgi:hypothetical protein
MSRGLRSALFAAGLAVALAPSFAGADEVRDEEIVVPPPPRREMPPPPPAEEMEPARPAAAVEGWKVMVAPYFWLAGTDGDLELDATTDSRVDANWWQLGDELDAGFGGGVFIEGRMDKLGIFVNPAFLAIDYDENFDNAGDADVDTDLWIVEAGLAYRVAEGGAPERQWAFDLLGGARYNNVDLDVDFPVGDADENEDWVDPFVGARARLPLADRVALSLWGDVGGFGVGSHFSWQSAATIGYSFGGEAVSPEVFIGYRALDTNYDDDDFEYDQIVHGPMVGVALKF